MTPGARVAAAIEVLEKVLEGQATETALTRWARANRYAGSKDRRAVRDLVFQSVRNLQSYQSVTLRSEGFFEARDILIGCVRSLGWDVDEVFSGSGYAPAVLTDAEQAAERDSGAQAWNLPEWVKGAFVQSLGSDTGFSQARLMSERAPVTLRTNNRKTSRDVLIANLQTAGLEVFANPLASTAISLRSDARGLTGLDVFLDGHFELQDASSQAVTEAIEISDTTRVLDYCAGGGGKTLALAARTACAVTAHDADLNRMKDLPQRAKRAGASCRIVGNKSELTGQTFDLVLVDAPCSGSGSWRRAPDAKWRLTPEALANLQSLQSDILNHAAHLVGPGGTLAYATCSILDGENSDQISEFVDKNPEWNVFDRKSWQVTANGDGFFLAQLKRK